MKRNDFLVSASRQLVAIGLTVDAAMAQAEICWEVYQEDDTGQGPEDIIETELSRWSGQSHKRGAVSEDYS